MAWISPKRNTTSQPKPLENTWEELAALEDQFPVFTRIPEKSVHVGEANIPGVKGRAFYGQKKAVKSSYPKLDVRKHVAVRKKKKHAPAE